MIKNYKLALIGLLVSCSLSHAMESDEPKAFSKQNLEDRIEEVIKHFDASRTQELLELLVCGKKNKISLDNVLLQGCIKGIGSLFDNISLFVDSDIDVTSSLIQESVANIKSVSLIGCYLVSSGLIDVEQKNFVNIEKIKVNFFPVCLKLPNNFEQNPCKSVSKLYRAIRKKVEETS